jgi:DNA-binding winged helix-turn-helix (wHTH) protein
MDKPISRFYEFGPFRLDTWESSLERDGQAVSLPPKLFGLLLYFVQNSGRTLSKEDIASAVWPDGVSDETLAKNVSRLRNVLGEGRDGQHYIETKAGFGYRFTPQVRVVPDQYTSSADQPARARTIQVLVRPESGVGVSTVLVEAFAGHLWHVLAASSLYAGLYVVTLLIETAYQFDKLGRTALKLSPFIFVWVLGTSLGGLWLGGELAVREKGYLGLVVSVSTFIGAAAITCAAVGLFLPASPITESLTQAQTAQSAYLKDIYYSLILAVLFVIPPFCFVVGMQRELQAGRHATALELLSGSKLAVAPSGTVYLRPWMLGVALMVMASLSVYLTANLLDHITPSPHMNLFTNLIYLRLILYYGLGVECLAWYYRALNDLKRECLAARG